MNYIIHRGRHEIGGMCIEVAAADGTRVLLDLGMPLYDEAGGDYPYSTPQRPTRDLLDSGVLKAIPGLYPHDSDAPSISAIILTHAHLDHYGLAHHAHPGIPVYASQGTLAILEVSRVFFPDNDLPADLRVLPDAGPTQLGGISVTAIPVDHAAPDSRALLIEADGERLLYSGDLRAHGRTGFHFENMLDDPRLHGVDYMLLEGTTLGVGAAGHGMRTEQDVEEVLASLAREKRSKLLAVIASGQNLDRLVSCYRAARRSGRLLVIDPYQAFVLMKLAPLSHAIPQFTWDGVKVSFAPHQVERLKAAGLMDLVYEMGRLGRVGSKDLAARPGDYVVCARGSYGTTKLLDRVGADNTELVWSMWSGYWEREKCAMREWAEGKGVESHFVHSGGHAWPEDLERLKMSLQATTVEIVHSATA